MKNYNYLRKKLLLPEYGRHIHEMVDFLSTIEDRQLRNQQANAVIGVIGNLNPMLRDTADFAHKLWDHLFIMADFKLDVDSPYPIPSQNTLAPKPEKLAYPDKRVKMKHYGKNVEHILSSLKGVEDRREANEVIGNIARYMRTKSYEYNQEHPNNESIINDIKRLSGYGVVVDEEALGNLKSEYKQQTHSSHQGGKKNGQKQAKKGMPNNKNNKAKRRIK